MSDVLENISIQENVFKLNEKLIPALLNHALYMQSITFPSFKKHISESEFKKKSDEFNDFLKQCESYLDNH